MLVKKMGTWVKKWVAALIIAVRALIWVVALIIAVRALIWVAAL